MPVNHDVIEPGQPGTGIYSARSADIRLCTCWQAAGTMPGMTRGMHLHSINIASFIRGGLVLKKVGKTKRAAAVNCTPPTTLWWCDVIAGANHEMLEPDGCCALYHPCDGSAQCVSSVLVVRVAPPTEPSRCTAQRVTHSHPCRLAL